MSRKDWQLEIGTKIGSRGLFQTKRTTFVYVHMWFSLRAHRSKMELFIIYKLTITML